MKKVIVAALMALVIYSLVSCKKDHLDVLAPCKIDTTNVIFANTAQPVFSLFCTNCHTELETEADTKAWSSYGRIVDAINHTKNASAMPQGSSTKLSACDLRKITLWINQQAAQ
jgi:hypothetical protein